jgi:uncharacterized protein (DUF1778 family)
MSEGKRPAPLRMQLRARPAQRRILRQAAAASARSVNAFVLDSACAAAYQMLADRSGFAMEDPDWEHFLALLGRTADEKERLRALLAGPV